MSAAASATSPAPSAIAQRVGRALARHPQRPRDGRRGDTDAPAGSRRGCRLNVGGARAPGVTQLGVTGQRASWPQIGGRCSCGLSLCGPSSACDAERGQAATAALRCPVVSSLAALSTAIAWSSAVGLAPAPASGLPQPTPPVPRAPGPRAPGRARARARRAATQAAHHARPAGRSGSRRPRPSRAAAGAGSASSFSRSLRT